MNTKKIVLLFLIALSLHAQESQKGIIRVPVAQLVGQPLGSDAAYAALPVCGGTYNFYLSCPRMHQLLLHETVDIIQAAGDELFIDVPQTFYVTESTKVPQTRYWTSKKNIIPLDELKKNGVDLNQIPPPISFQDPSTLGQSKSVVTLLKPFYDRTAKLTYSAGTRFVIKRITHDKKYILVYALDPASANIQELKIPRTYLIQSNNDDPEKKIKTFVDILKLWAHQDGYVPYIWGGCSFAHTENSHTILEHIQECAGQKRSWYTRHKPHEENALLKSGFDCAGLINRAAQMAGIPFFFKNTRTIAEHMAQLEPDEQLQPGDIIWIRGHVMVVADLRHNTIIEARGYDSDYGRVHEIEIGKVFAGIKTFDDLKRAWMEKVPLVRLNKAGKVQDQFKQVKLLKMKSVFKTDAQHPFVPKS